MAEKTVTMYATITVVAEEGHLAFDTTALADIIKGALEVGVQCVVKGMPDVKVPSVYAAEATVRRA